MLSGLLAARYVKYVDLPRAKSEALVYNTYKQKIKQNRVMLNGKGCVNGIKINSSKEKKKQIWTCSTLFGSFLCRCFARLQCVEELSYVLTQNFVSCVHVRCYFFTAANFHLAGLSLLTAGIYHFLTAAMKYSCFFCYFNKFRLLCFQSLAIALSLLSA